jgi:hypothetical protein
MPDLSKKFVTRKDAPHYIRETHGVPVSASTFNKSRMYGRPKPDAFYGAKELFRPETLDEYAAQIISDKPRELVPRGRKRAFTGPQLHIDAE